MKRPGQRDATGWSCARPVWPAAPSPGPTTEIDHEPGEELQLDWWELSGWSGRRPWSTSRATAQRSARAPRPERHGQGPPRRAGGGDRFGHGRRVARHRRVPSGAAQTIRCAEHGKDLERAVLGAFTTAPPCKAKANRPPGPAALAAAAKLRGEEGGEVLVDLDRYAQIAGVAR